MLDLLYQKIGVFQTILGDLNHILGTLVKSTEDGRCTQLEGEIMKYRVHRIEVKSDNMQEKLEQFLI